MFKDIAFTLIYYVLVIGWRSSAESEKLITARHIIAEVSKELVPEKRVARFEVEAWEHDGQLILNGE